MDNMEKEDMQQIVDVAFHIQNDQNETLCSSLGVKSYLAWLELTCKRHTTHFTVAREEEGNV
jgi:hypothetical protein